MNSSWTVSTTDYAGDKEALMRRGNVYQIANGYMGYRGTLDEHGPDESVGIMLAGIFDQAGAAWREPVNAPNGGYTTISVDGVALSTSATGKKNKVVRHQQALQLTNALHERETVYSVPGKKVIFRSARFLSADPATPNLGVITFSVTCDKAAKIEIRTGIDYNIWDLNGPHLLKLTATKRDKVLVVTGTCGETGKKACVSEVVSRVGEQSGSISERFESTAKSKRHLRLITIKAGPRQTYTFHKYFAVVTDNDRISKPIADAAAEIAIRARDRGYAACLAAHNSVWKEKWDCSDVVIEGDAEAQRALRYSIFQLLIVAPVRGSANSIPARALSGQVYKGAIFWDTEMFMFPFFLHTAPEKAVELLRYRIKTLDGARRKAQTEGPGYRGAFYAWESQETGDDACTYFNIGDPTTGRDLRTHFRDKQVHISGDVAIAMWTYFRTTGDDSLLLEGGAEVILECARFYYSYAYYSKDKARYEVLDVIGPDEYHERVNNNAFTNMVVRETFAIANAVVEYLAKKHPAAHAKLLAKLSIAGELASFHEAERQLYIPQPDQHTRVIEQFDTYFKLRDTRPAALVAQKIHPNEYLGAGQGLAVPTQVIKQADVVMMLNLFKDRYSAEVKQANWEYYEPRTEHGSSLSACAYALVATECGKLDVAYQYFLKTAKIDIEAKYKVYVGTIFMGGSHPAANGGAWMTAVQGFGGLRIDQANSKVVINPRLPKKWRRLCFSLVFRGNSFRVAATKDGVLVEPGAANTGAQIFVVAGREYTCSPGNSVTHKYHP